MHQTISTQAKKQWIYGAVKLSWYIPLNITVLLQSLHYFQRFLSTGEGYVSPGTLYVQCIRSLHSTEFRFVSPVSRYAVGMYRGPQLLWYGVCTIATAGPCTLL